MLDTVELRPTVADPLPLTGALPPVPLPGPAAVAYADLQATFALWGHRPSSDQWAALRDLLEHLEIAAAGDLERAVYVSAIPAGCGKSSALQAFARALASDPGMAGVGMLIAVSRVEEARDMARALHSIRDKLCVIVAEKHVDTLALGDHRTADEAQVVVCTQAALKVSLRATGDFDRATRFFYRGQRRAVVCWDEALAFARPVVLDRDEVVGLTKAMGRQSRDAVDALLRWALSLSSCETGICQVPDFGAHGLDFRQLEMDVGEDDLAVQARALGIVSGGSAYVMAGNEHSAAVVSAIPEIPESLMPVLVTDASAAEGVHHASYEQMGRTRRIIRLTEAGKTYRNMTVRVVTASASRSTYADQKSTRGKELIDLAASYVRSSEAATLVVSYKRPTKIKGVKQRTIREAIDAGLSPEEQSRVRHLTWGSHTSTNDHKDVSRVFLSGLNFLPRSASYAASGAAQGLPMRSEDPSDHPTATQVEEMRKGMLRDSTMQAILRGNARMGVDGDCGVCEVVIVMAARMGLTLADLSGMFPGATIAYDHSLLPPKPLKGRVKQLAEAIERHRGAGRGEVSNVALGEELGMDKGTLARLLKHPSFVLWAKDTGCRTCKLKGNLAGLKWA